MNRQEAGRVLAVISSPYQGEPLEADGAEVWFEAALRDRDFEDAMVVALTLVKTSGFRPTPATFNAAWRQRALTPPTVGALPSGQVNEVGQARVQEIIAELRDMLAATGARQHWHGGPTPCYVCGGMKALA